MKDHRLAYEADTRYLARRARRRHLLLAPAERAQRADSPNAELPAPIVHGTYNGGLRRDQLLGDFATVQVTVGPWDFPQMTDIIVLHWGTQWTQEFPVKDINGAQLLAIPGVDIAGDPLNDGDHYSGEGTQAVWYEVRTAGGTLPASATTEVVVKTARPGGQDPRPDTPVNDNLATPVASPDPVEQDATEVTFSVIPWKNITNDDKLVLVLGGYRFDFPAITQVTATQTLTLSAAQIAAIGGGPKTPVTYEITDLVGNRSGYAPYLLLDIWLEGEGLLEMIELVDDDGHFIDGAIDPTLAAALARVPRYVGWTAGESVTVMLEGVDSDEQEHTTTLGPLDWKPSDYYLDFPIPNEVLRVLAGGIVRVHYQTSAGKLSFRRLYVVDALPETGLPPVTVRGEQGGELPLDSIVGDYVSIVVPDSEALVDFARITLTMEGNGANGPVLEEEVHNVGEGEGHTPYTFAWAKTRVAALLEHTATFRYSVRTLDAGRAAPARPRLYRPLAIRDSEPHDLLVKQSSSGGQLAAPVIPDLVDGSLPPTQPTLKVTVPGGTASVPGAKVVTTVVGLTTVTHTDRIFDQGETLHVDFPGWPALNDGAKATASYTINDVPSKEAKFNVGEAVPPFDIDDTLVKIKVDDDFAREATGGKLPYTYTSSNTAVVSVPHASNATIHGMAAGSATITARDNAGASGSYPVTVATTPFYIDPSQINLTGIDFDTRDAKGGTPPYTYTSSNTAVVKVPNPNQGRIDSVADGNAIITARDSAAGVGTYPVNVSGNAIIEDFEGAPVGETSSLNTGTMRISSQGNTFWITDVGSSGQPPFFNDNTLIFTFPVSYAGSLTIEFLKEHPRVSFGILAVVTAGSIEIQALDANDQIISRLPFFPGQAGTRWVDISGNGRYIKTIYIPNTAGTGAIVYLDNFTLNL